MSEHFSPGEPFWERRRSNRAILTVVAMAFAAIALNDGVHSLTTPAGASSLRQQRLVPDTDRKSRADAIVQMREVAEAAGMTRARLDLCDGSGGGARFSSPPRSAR